jgi:hypothetical protein
MATIIPLDNTSFTTSGERRFYHFLRDAVKPDAQCLAWYSPTVDGLEPDFILYTPEAGLIVFEVKDWVLSQIRGADTHSFRISVAADKEESRTNPFYQSRTYALAILNRIKASCKRLLSTDQRYYGKSRLPVQWGVVLSNITREEFNATDLGKILPADKVFFADDLTAALSKDDVSTNAQPREQLAAMFPPLFPFNLTMADMSALREVLWPQVRIILPKRGDRKYNDDSDSLIKLLDAQQETLASRLDAPKAILKGYAGTGKSLVLIHKAFHEYTRLRNKKSELPVLVVCYNLTLTHYLKRLLAGRGAHMGRNDIHVTHFYDFCRSLLKEPLAYENENADYYELVTRMALDAAKDSPRYGAVFVDEGQDFSDDMFAVLQAVLAENGMFWLARDSAQNLYEKKQSWLDDPGFRRFFLRSPYRATRSLAHFCESLVSHTKADVPEHEQPFPVQSAKGEAPCLYRIADIRQGVTYLADRIHRLREQGIPYSEMAILYVSRNYGDLQGIDLPVFLCDSLEENGIMVSWPSKNAQSKATWDITTDSVAVSTIHSMKGMDAEAVFVLGLDSLNKTSVSSEFARSLTYVACTRARRHLDILYIEKTPLIESMLRIQEISHV